MVDRMTKWIIKVGSRYFQGVRTQVDHSIVTGSTWRSFNKNGKGLVSSKMTLEPQIYKKFTFNPVLCDGVEDAKKFSTLPKAKPTVGKLQSLYGKNVTIIIQAID